jgi:AcrR family transcriptional regulator
MKTAFPSSMATRERLLRGAAVVFARDGLAGATTRAIAEEAGVNEVTLFRQFQTKEKLLAAVVQENFGAEAVRSLVTIPPTTDDLRHDLTAYAELYERRLRENLPLVRAMMGEIHRHAQGEREVFRALFRPLRQALIERLDASRARGELPAAARSAILSDLFIGMIFTGVLRRAAADAHHDYSADDYRQAAVELLIRGTTAG